MYNQEQIDELKNAIKPVVEWVNKNTCPHDVVLISQGRVQVVSGEFGFPTEVLD